MSNLTLLITKESKSNFLYVAHSMMIFLGLPEVELKINFLIAKTMGVSIETEEITDCTTVNKKKRV